MTRKQIYDRWNRMKYRVKNHPSYKNVSICEEWYSFENFYNWVLQHKELINSYDNWDIDKDILQLGKDSKIYSPKTCCILPSAINKAINFSNHKTMLGCHYDSERKLWQCKVRVHNKTKFLGRFKTSDEAHKVYKDFKLNHINNLLNEYSIKDSLKIKIIKYVKYYL